MTVNESNEFLDQLLSQARMPAPILQMAREWTASRKPWAGPLAVDSPADLAGLIDHTLLKPVATPSDIDRLCAEAAAHRFKSVCVNPCNVGRAAAALKGHGVLVCTVVGFPLGATTHSAKAFETSEAVASGATEIDMVINQGAVLAGDWDMVRRDIDAVVRAASGNTVKVIIETCNLNDEAKIGACLASCLSGASFVKTSTGFGSGGATEQDISLMRAVVGSGLSVKASGGIRTTADAVKMVAAGANRIGASASVAIIGA